MGLNFRKSIKLGKNTRINLSKTGGIGISTGVKGARVSVNKKGIRTSVGSNGLRYQKNYSFKDIEDTSARKKEKKTLADKIANSRDCQLERIKIPKSICRLFIADIILFTAGIIFIPIILIAFIALIVTLFVLLFNKQYMGGCLYINKAIIHWERRELEKSKHYCVKGLNKYDCETGRKLLEMINEEVS